MAEIEFETRNCHILTDYYFTARATAETFNFFGWVDSPIGSRKNLFEIAPSLVVTMNVQGKDRTVDRQNAVSTQINRGVRAIITTNTQIRVGQARKKSYQKRSIVFPYKMNNIWVSHALYEGIKNKTLIRPYKGALTWKRTGGDRFYIGKHANDVLTRSINEFLRDQEENRLATRETTTTQTEMEDFAATT